MKKLIIYVLLFLCFSSLCFADLVSDNYLYFSYDTDDIIGSLVVDASGTLNASKLAVNEPSQSNTSVLNESVIFDGTNDWINATRPNKLINVTGAISLWINTTTVSDALLFRGGSCTTDYWFLYLNSDGGLRWETRGNVGTDTFSSTFNVSTGTWRHVVFNKNGTNGSFYVDGTIILSTLLRHNYTENLNFDLRVGTCEPGSLDYEGRMDELAIYLEDHIDKGLFCIFRKDPKINWKIYK